MSDTTQVETPAEDNSAMKQMRDELKRKDQTIKDQRTKLVGASLTTIGLEAGTGLGKAIAAQFDGEVTDEAVAAFAKEEYGHEVVVEPNQQAEDIQNAQQRVDQFAGASGSLQPTSGEDVIAAHDQKLAQPDANRKDASRSIEAKLQHYVEQTL